MDKIRMIYEIILNTAMTVLARARPTRMETLNYRQLQDHPVGYPIAPIALITWESHRLTNCLINFCLNNLLYFVHDQQTETRHITQYETIDISC